MRRKLSDIDISEIIEQAWCDKTSFDDIFHQLTMNENDIKKVLRKNLRKRSYVHWRKRISKIKQNKNL
tara:strand:+ start:454 stop:657 length:204 start_codon:yes stop_codon:yes gene_type:complete